jgi:hypothetical protein
VYGNQGRESIQQKYKAKESTRRHNAKKKTKANNQRKIRKRKLYANMTQGYEMMINDNKKGLRWKKNCVAQIGQ